VEKPKSGEGEKESKGNYGLPKLQLANAKLLKQVASLELANKQLAQESDEKERLKTEIAFLKKNYESLQHQTTEINELNIAVFAERTDAIRMAIAIFRSAQTSVQAVRQGSDVESGAIVELLKIENALGEAIEQFTGKGVEEEIEEEVENDD
jgi:tRNA G10  N-methylase Trm11